MNDMNTQSFVNQARVRLSMDEYLAMNPMWLERQRENKKKTTMQMIVVAISIVAIVVGLIVGVPILTESFYMDLGTAMIVCVVVGMLAFVGVAVGAVYVSHKADDESERLKSELYSQYLRENGFL